MKRLKYFLVVFSVFALLLSFSAVDVKAGAALGTVDDCVHYCQTNCQTAIVGCREFCRTTFAGSEVGNCIKFACALYEECCMNQCLWAYCEIGSEEDSLWCY